MFFELRRKSSRSSARLKSSRQHRLQVESLESRQLLAVTLLKDVAPAGGSSNASDFTTLGNLTFFTANDNSNGVELWKTDGTANGTVMVKDIAPGAASSAPQQMTVFNGKLYFTANDQVHGRELWSTDGTANGTQMVMDIDNIASSSPDYLTVVGNELLFAAYDATHGTELWRTDGTTTEIVQDLRSGAFGSTPEYLTNVNGTLYFSANNTDAIGRELWRYDSTNGIALVRNIADLSFESANPQELTAVGDKLYFTAVGPSDNYFGRELYVTDGTSNGTIMVQDINPGVADSTPMYLANNNGTLWFSANTAAAGRELWKSDGSSLGTEMVYDYTPGSGGSNPVSIVRGGAGAFVHYDTYNYIVYFPDSGPVEYRGNNIYPGTQFVSGPGKLFFSRANSGFNYELWQIDTTTRAVTLVNETNPSTGSYPMALAYSNGSLFFTANDGTHGNEPFVLPFAPAASITGVPTNNTGPEGTAVNLSASITSPGSGGPYTYAWSVQRQGAQTPLATGNQSTFSYTPPDNGNYDVTLTVTDSSQQQGTTQVVIAATNVAPSVTITGVPNELILGESVTLNSQVTDPGSADILTYEWIVTHNANPIASGTSTSLTFTPASAGTYAISLTVQDDDVGSGNDGDTLNVTLSIHQIYVQQMYMDLLGAAPSPNAFTYWSNQLAAGVPRTQLARALLATIEHRQHRVTTLYQQYLNRAADSSGLTFWSNFLVSRPEAEFKSALLSSNEYYSRFANNTLYVESLYTNILGRSGDPAGVAHWVSLLGTGASARTTVVNALLRSREAVRRQVDEGYQLLLRRPVDSAGATFWVDALIAGNITYQELLVRLIGSGEYLPVT